MLVKQVDMIPQVTIQVEFHLIGIARFRFQYYNVSPIHHH